MSSSPESYSYERGSGATVHHYLRNDPSSRRRRCSLRISHLPPESEDITLESVDEEDLPEYQRAFNPPPSVNGYGAHDAKIQRAVSQRCAISKLSTTTYDGYAALTEYSIFDRNFAPEGGADPKGNDEYLFSAGRRTLHQTYEESEVQD
jgi:hypothetical protein